MVLWPVWRSEGNSKIMLIVFALLILWILSMYFYLPLPIVVLLFAALASGISITAWMALNNRQRVHQTVVNQDTKY